MLALHLRDHPAAIRRIIDSSLNVRLLFDLEEESQRRKIDDFEGEYYMPTAGSLVVPPITLNLTR